MAKCCIRVDYHNREDNNPYAATYAAVQRQINQWFWEEIGDLIIRIQVDDDEPFNTLLMFDGRDCSFYWQYDWCEGENITILGIALVSRVKLY